MTKHSGNFDLSKMHKTQLDSVGAVLNPVHKMIARAHNAFSTADHASHAASADCVAVIERFLKVTGWAQGTRRVFESMPHAGALETVEAFRTVLFHLGYNTLVEEATPEKLRSEYLPCFLRTHSGRIILIEKSDDPLAVAIFDPSSKKRVDLPQHAIKGTLIFPERHKETEDNAANAKKNWSSRAFLAFFPNIKQIFFLSFLVNVFALAAPLYVMSVYDKAIGAKSPGVLLGLTIGIMMIIAADFALREIRSRMQAYLGARLDEQANETAFRQLLHMPLSFIEDAPIGSQLTRMRQMTAVREAFIGALATALFDLPYIFLFIAVTAMIGGVLVWPPVALILVYASLAAWAIPRTKHLVVASGNAKAKLHNLTVEAVAAQGAIKDLAAEETWRRRYRQLSAESAMSNMKARQFSFLIHTLSQSLVAASGVATLAFGASMVIAGDLSGGALIAVMALAWRILGPIRNAFLSGLTIGQTLQSIEQIDRLEKMPREREPNASPSISRSFTGHIVCENVAFRYPSQREPALRGVSFEVKPGELLCLCGASGAGKSSVLRILLGLQQQQAGSVFVDGLDLRQIDKGEWRHSLGVAPQSADLYYGTIAQNLRLAHPAATDADIKEMIERFGIEEYFDNVLTEGFETRFKTDARATWPDALIRRIVLARAFVEKRPIYLLDDPAANLDAAGEKALMALIAERRETSTIIMTSHRPSFMRMADTIVWLDRGAVRDMGPPQLVVPRQLAA